MRVLFLGNSHTYYNDMPNRVCRLLAGHGEESFVTMLAHGGMGLDFHAKEPEVRFNILYGDYDWVVLQHVVHTFGEGETLFPAARRIQEMIAQTRAKTLLYLTWEEKERAAAQPKMTDCYLQLSRELQVPVAPVGEVWHTFRRLHPEIELYDPDGRHASPFGSQLAACVLATALLGQPVSQEEPVWQEVSRLAWEQFCHFREIG